MRHSFEKKLNIISLIKSDYSLSAFCTQQNIDHHLVRSWLLRYDKYGQEGLRLPTKGYYFIPEEKENIVFEHLQKGVTLQQLCLNYDINRSTIIAWLKKVRSGGSLFDIKQRGRPPQDPMTRPKKKEQQTESMLINHLLVFLRHNQKKLDQLFNRHRFTGKLNQVAFFHFNLNL